MNFVIAIAIAVTLTGLIAGPWARSTLWRATITPLASIIGSGFLIIGPILSSEFGHMAPVVMAGLCVIAYAFGSTVRFNINALGRAPVTRFQHHLDRSAEWVLGFAYVVSVAYYLNLFGSFAISLIPNAPDVAGKWITTIMFFALIIVGGTKGFQALERLEALTVCIKLAIIVGLLIGLTGFASTHTTATTPAASRDAWTQICMMFGLLVTVQGFETSRYLGAEYDVKTRIRSMRLAQGMSTIIYIVYIALISAFIAVPATAIEETEIIGLMGQVATILPIALVFGALSAQSSAAVADTAGAGGLFAELSNDYIKPSHAYALVGGIGIALTWTQDIFVIIAYASRAFAIYYTAQAALATHISWSKNGISIRTIGYGAMSILGGMIAIFGVAFE